MACDGIQSGSGLAQGYLDYGTSKCVQTLATSGCEMVEIFSPLPPGKSSNKPQNHAFSIGGEAGIRGA